MLSTQQIEFIKATVPVLRESGVALTDYFYKRMLNNHPELKETFNMGHQRSGGQAKALAGAVLAYAENIENLAVLGDAVNLIVAKHVSLNIQADQYAIVGENLLHSISEVLGVPMDSDLIAAWAAAYGQLADILIAAEKQRYAEQAATQGGWNGWREFKVVRKQPESSVITSFYLQAVDGGDLPAYQPGQYVSVRVEVPELGIKQPRQYSLSQAANGNELRISVKRESEREALAAGYVSNTLHEHVQEGDVLELSNPNGDFVLNSTTKANVFISAGVGITPMMAMLGQVAAHNMPEATSFIHACRDEHSLSMSEAVAAIKQRFPQLQTYLACETQPETDLEVQTIGRLNLQTVGAELLPREADYYVCGPVGFMQIQYQSLLGLGIAPEQIHMEAFDTGGIAAVTTA